MRAERSSNRSRGGRRRGFTLSEILVSLGLVSLLAMALLAAAQTQLVLYRDGQRMQAVEENARAGLEVLAHDARLVGAPSRGWGFANSTGVGPAGLPFYKVVDSYSNLDATGHGADRLELIIPAGELVALASAAAPMSTSLELLRLDPESLRAPGTRAATADLSVGDYLLLSNVSILAPSRAASSVPPPPMLTAQPLCSASTTLVGAVLAQVQSVASPTTVQLTAPLDPSGCDLAAGSLVGRASVVAYYLSGADLVLDDGAQLRPAGSPPPALPPVAESIIDLQIAVGVDANGDGILSEVGQTAGDDEWYMNVDGESMPLDPPSALRLTVVARTPVRDPGDQSAPGRPAVENHPAGPQNDGYRYRVVTTTVVPRNLVQP